MYTKPFNEISKSDTPIAGGKGASLGELTQAGIPVPPGYVVLTDAFTHFFNEAGLNAQIDKLMQSVNHEEMDSITAASEQIHSLIQEVAIPQEIITEIDQAFSALGAELVAVRSSATAEDSSVASWAGELETYLNVTTNNLHESIKKCWSSLYTPRAIFYRCEKGLQNEPVAVAVVVQKMVQSVVSGIAFTVHPVTKDYNQMVIEAGYGLGEAIVGGMVTPDTYVITKDAIQIQDKHISEQTMRIVRSNTGTHEETVPATIAGLQKFSDAQILELAELCMHIEEHYGTPQDIEWAFEAGTIHITQSRPITTL